MAPLDGAAALADVAALPGVVCARLVSRRRNGTTVTLQTYRHAGSCRGGGGPAASLLLLEHGMCGAADNFVFQLRAAVARGAAFFCYDVVGCARSGDEAGANMDAHFIVNMARMYAPAQLEDDLANAWRFATDGGARPCLLVAHSYGTSVATRWLARLARAGPGALDALRLWGVVLLGTHASLPPLAASRAARLMRALPLALQYTAIELYQGPGRYWRLFCHGENASMGSLGPAGARSAAARALWLAWERQKSPQLYAASVCTFEWACEQDFAAAYSRVPLALCWGDVDGMTPPDVRFLRRSVAPALAALKICQGYGHWAFLDNADFDAWFWTVVGTFAAARGRANAPVLRTLVIEAPPAEPATMGISNLLVGAEAGGEVPSSPPAACAGCGAHAETRCRDCNTVYCGAECQELDWLRGHDARHGAVQ